MNNIEKLAEPTEQEYLAHAEEEELLLFASEDDYLAIANGVWELFVKRAKALQSSEPVADTLNKLANSMVDLSAEDKKLIQDNLWNLYQGETTHPPASVPLEKYKNLLKVAKHIQSILHHPSKAVSVLDAGMLDDAIAEAEGKEG